MSAFARNQIRLPPNSALTTSVPVPVAFQLPSVLFESLTPEGRRSRPQGRWLRIPCFCPQWSDHRHSVPKQTARTPGFATSAEPV
jgi:hypothetical protein